MACKAHRASHRGPACRAAHPEVVERRRAGGWETNTHGGRNASGRQCIAAAGEYLSPLRVRSVGSGMASKQAHGDVIVVRYADDIVVGFQSETDAKQVLAELTERFRKFSLELHPDKTRLLEFGRFAARNREQRGEGKPETFAFLGFTHICGKTRSNGYYTLLRQTIRKRMQAKLMEGRDELRRSMSDSIPDVGL